MCDDSKQLLYTKCSYMYPSGIQCTNPVPKYLDPLLCGGHCDNIRPPEDCVEKLEGNVKQEITLASVNRVEEASIQAATTTSEIIVMDNEKDTTLETNLKTCLATMS